MKFKKALACIMCASMVCASLTGCGSDEAKTAENITINESNDKVYESAEDQELEAVVKHIANAGSSSAAKQETVYVKTNPNGVVDSVVVSNWLKNVDNTEELIDSSDLNDITNVKGDEEYQIDKDGNYVWETNGDDIYYQGTTDKKLPVDVYISYKLNGNSIAAEDLAGKSGHVEIDLTYKNNCENTAMINDKEETIYTPFAVVSGMMLDEEKFSNIKVSNGTVICDGKRDIVVGMAFPGLVDSLNGAKIEDEDLMQKIEDNINIPSEVTIEADVEDFESGMILTMISSDIIDSLGLDGIDSIDTSDIQDSIKEFSDAGQQLADGTGKLKDGAQALADGTKDLVDGTNRLHNGVVAYTDGVGKVADGAVALDDGASKLDNGANDLKNGISELDNGMESLNSGISRTAEGAGTLKNGAEAVNNGALQLKTGAEAVSAGVDALTGQMGNIAGGVGQAASAAGSISGGIDAIVSATGTDTLPEDIDTSSISVTGLVDGDKASAIMLDNLPSDQLKAMGLTPEQIEGVKSIVSTVSSGVIPSVVDNAATGAAQAAAKQAGANGANEVKQQINAAITTPGENGLSLQQGAAMLSSSLNDSYASLTSESTTSQLAALKNGAANLASGAGDLAQGTSSLKDGASALYDGTKQLGEGSQKIKNGTSALNDGISTLKEGTATLKNGTGDLVKGTNELNSNSAQLVDGSKALADGSVTLTDGIDQLLIGSTALNEGMIKFNSDGIQKLTAVFDTDMDSINNRIKAISDAGKAYKSFGGTSQDEDCSVKFIIESEEIKK